MTKRTSNLLRMALELSEEERIELAYALEESATPFKDPAIEEAWNKEISRRIKELDSGRAKTVPWKEVQEKVKQKLR